MPPADMIDHKKITSEISIFGGTMDKTLIKYPKTIAVGLSAFDHMVLQV